jgi:hypothetical protein
MLGSELRVYAGDLVLLLDDVRWTLRGKEELTAGGDGSDLQSTQRRNIFITHFSTMPLTLFRNTLIAGGQLVPLS